MDFAGFRSPAQEKLSGQGLWQVGFTGDLLADMMKLGIEMAGRGIGLGGHLMVIYLTSFVEFSRFH